MPRASERAPLKSVDCYDAERQRNGRKSADASAEASGGRLNQRGSVSSPECVSKDCSVRGRRRAEWKGRSRHERGGQLPSLHCSSDQTAADQSATVALCRVLSAAVPALPLPAGESIKCCDGAERVRRDSAPERSSKNAYTPGPRTDVIRAHWTHHRETPRLRCGLTPRGCSNTRSTFPRADHPTQDIEFSGSKMLHAYSSG